MPRFDRSRVILSRKVMPFDRHDFKLQRYITPELREQAEAISTKIWLPTKILDQGETGHCVGFAEAGFGIAPPIEDTDFTNDTGHAIYYKAKEIDGEPGGEDGTDTRSGVKAAQFFMNIPTYAFTTDIEDIKVWVKTKGPVVVGTNWYDGMFDPDSSFIVHLTGYVAGGHEYVIIGVDDTTGLFCCLNSWGKSFGKNGLFYISYSDMARLESLLEQGDAVTMVEEPHDPVPPDPTPEPSGCLTVVVPLLKSILSELKKLNRKK